MTELVTLASDFDRYYPAAMRGVLIARGIDRVVDVSHQLPSHDIRQSAFWLRELLPYYPPAVHCVVVDPGVGSDRAVIALDAGCHVCVGPDNGVLWPLASRLADPTDIEAFRFEHTHPASATFHGRDVFAPLAAAIANLGIDRFHALPTLRRFDTPKQMSLPGARGGDGWIETEVIAIDPFGTAITGATGSMLPIEELTEVTVNGTAVSVATHYSAVDIGIPLVTVGSHDHVELAANQASGHQAFTVEVGDPVTIRW